MTTKAQNDYITSVERWMQASGETFTINRKGPELRFIRYCMDKSIHDRDCANALILAFRGRLEDRMRHTELAMLAGALKAFYWSQR